MSNLIVVNARCKLGQKKDGVNLAPDFITNYLDESINPIEIEFNDVYNGYQRLYDKLNENLNKFRLTIGGDHSIGVSTIQPVLEYCNDELLVVWIDAHADINTYKTSLTKNTHGMPLSALTGLMEHWYKPKTNKKLQFNQIVYVGIRDIDEAEKMIINENNIMICNDISKLSELFKNKKIHISLDIDGIDPLYMPSTGTKSDNGLNMKFVIDILKEANKNDFVSCDLVEYNPLLGTNEERQITENNIVLLMNEIMKNK